jgi:uncharacterized protein YoxC
MSGIIYISILFIATAFLIATIYICVVLHRMMRMMKSLSQTLGTVEKQVENMKPHLLATLKETDLSINDLEEKLKATDSMFDSVQILGESVQSANTAVQNGIGNLTEEEMDKMVKPYIEGIKWSEASLELFKKWKKEKSA